MIKADPSKVNWLEMSLRIWEMPTSGPSPQSLAHPAPSPLHTAAVSEKWINIPTAALGPVHLWSPDHLPLSTYCSFFFPLPFPHFSVASFTDLDAIILSRNL